MRKKEFNHLYAQPDPWGVSGNKNSRNYVLKKIFKKYLNKDNKVLELGCGEGNFSKYINEIGCKSHGIDISDIAIERAKKLNLNNYEFEAKELLDINFHSDIVVAIEVIYYLKEEERNFFFKKLQNKKIKYLLLSTPIIGGKYFTDYEVKSYFKKYKFTLLEEKNLNFYGNKNLIFKVINKIVFNPFFSETNFSYRILQILPIRYIYQKVYVVAPMESILYSNIQNQIVI